MKNIILIFILFSFTITAQKLEQSYQGDGVVWGFDFISPTEILITHRDGDFFYYNTKSKEKIKLDAPKVHASGQGGLLDVLYIKGSVYLTFSEKLKDVVTTSLAKATYNDKKITNLETIFRAKVKSDTTRHFGSRLVIKNDDLFMTVGDRGERDYAQNKSLHNGKVLRLTLDGKAAKGNPFENVKNALPEIWSFGHRNPQGIDINPTDQALFSCEFGPRGGDELNLVKAGKNYGWPIITYGKEYWGPSIGPTHKKGLEQPITHWTPSISPSGMVFYTGDKISKWKNQLFLANLSSEHLRRLVIKNNEVVEQEELFKELDERIRQVRNSPDGYLYFSTDSGKIYKITP